MDLDEDSDIEWTEINELRAVVDWDNESSKLANSANFDTISSNSNETSDVIHEYYKTERALVLNKLYDEKLSKLENILKTRLNEIRQRLSEIQNTDPTNDKPDNFEVFRYIRCGKPYFKTSANVPAPPNQDTILMAESEMFDFSDIHSVPGWTLKDKKAFVDILHKMSRDIKERKLKSQLAQLKRDLKVKDCKSLHNEIKAVEAEMNSLNKKTLNELALPIDEEYDWDAVTCALNQRHSGHEYRALWKLYMHPSINKSSWTKTEHLSLQEIAQACNYQDWDDIALRLNTRRTGYQCFVYFRTNMSNTFTGQKWTNEEELYLVRLIEYYKEDGYIPWGKVAASIENRTKVQIYNKYIRLSEKRKGRFLPEEDAVMLTCVENFGTNFKKISEFLPGRSTSQLRVRYGVLARRRISTVWTVAEDKKLIQLMANNEAMINYANLTKHFPGKDRSNIRTRYVTLVKWMKQYPNKDLRQAPRRGARRLAHGCATDNLHKAIENLKNRMETEVEKKRIKKISLESSEQDIEDAIIANLVTENPSEYYDKNESVIEEENDSPNDIITSSESLSDKNLKNMLLLLKAKLDKRNFAASHYAAEFPGLLQTEEQQEFITIRSYSRKSSTKTFKLDSKPDIWGNRIVKMTEFVLPPHLATITGCRKLIDHVNKQKDTDYAPISIHLLSRRNCLFEEQLFYLLERFNILFVWPMMLSNRGPPAAETDSEISNEDISEGTSAVT